jgi:hypothetical protein
LATTQQFHKRADAEMCNEEEMQRRGGTGM